MFIDLYLPGLSLGQRILCYTGTFGMKATCLIEVMETSQSNILLFLLLANGFCYLLTLPPWHQDLFSYFIK